MKLLMAGQKWLGVTTLKTLSGLPGVTVARICAPPRDRLRR